MGAFIGWVWPKAEIDNVVEQKRAGILRGLPFSIDLISSAMRGGLDFMAAVRFYVNISDSAPFATNFCACCTRWSLAFPA